MSTRRNSLSAFALLPPLAGASSPGAHAGPTPIWERSIDVDAGSPDGGLIVVPDGQGGVFTVGASPIFAGGEDVIVIHYDASGAELWREAYDGVVTGGYDFPIDALADASGDLVIAADSETIDPNTGAEWWTFTVAAADGSIIWQRRHFGPGTFGTALVRDVAVGPSGEIVVGGSSRDDDSFADIGVVRYASDGALLWDAALSSAGFQADAGQAVAVGDDGSVAIAGELASPTGEVIVVALYSAAGAHQWTRTFDASTFQNLGDFVSSVAIDGDGAVYVGASGINNGVDGRDFVLLKYDAEGALAWDRRVVTTTADIEPVILIGADGLVYVSGSADGGHRIVAFDSSGAQLWTRVHAGAVSPNGARRHAVIDSDGAVAVLLRTVFTPGVAAFTIVRYASNGDVIDQTTVDPEGESRTPNGLGADAAGNLFATGWWTPESDRDILTYGLAHVPGDLDGDGAVGSSDLAILLGSWGACAPGGPCPADLDGDGVVGSADLAALLGSWT